MSKFPFIVMKIPGNQLLSRRLLGKVLQEEQRKIGMLIEQSRFATETEFGIGYFHPSAGNI